MSRRSKLTDEERISAVQEYLNGEGSYRSIARKYGVEPKLLRVLVGRAQTEGIESIKIRPVNRKYTVETKLAAVQEYLAGKGSQLDICKKSHITNNNLLIQWIKCYNNGKDFRERRRSERGITMNKGRNTNRKSA